MAWKAPLNFGGLSFRGIPVVADLKGFVDLSAFGELAHELAGVLPSHGFTIEDDPEEAAQTEPASAQTFELEDGLHELAFPPSAAAEDDPTAAPQDEPGFDPTASADIEAMNRNELFAYLKAHGASVSPPVTNAVLREKAHEAAAGV